MIKEKRNKMNRPLLFAAAASISTAAIATGGGDILWANGDPDYVTGAHSHRQNPRRSILDDFTVPDGPGWSLTDFHALYVWGIGVHDPTVELAIYRNLSDHPNGSGGEKGPDFPDGLVHRMAITDVVQTATGRNQFGRPEQRVDVHFDKFSLSPGKYWIDMWISAVGELTGQLVSRHEQKNPKWVAYDDIPPVPQPGRNIFGHDTDTLFTLTGKPVPEPLTLLAVAGGFGLLAARRRRA